MRKPSATLYQEIYSTVKKITRGRVATYGQIARLTGGCTARMVGYALFALPAASDIPWQRVINAQGKISLPQADGSAALQRTLLEKEAVVFDSGNRIDLQAFGWQPDLRQSGNG